MYKGLRIKEFYVVGR